MILKRIAPAVPLLWFTGMMIFSISHYMAGLGGSPRRTSDVTYGWFIPAEWILPLQTGAVGALISATGGLLFLTIFFGSLMLGSRLQLPQPVVLLFNPHPPGKATVFDRIALVVVASIPLNIIAYSGALIELYGRGLQPVPPILPQPF